jgi:kynurenine formamidase
LIHPFTVSNFRSPEDLARQFPMQGMSFHLETITGGIHQGTHIDAFIHAQFAGRTFGGHDMKEVRTDFGWTRHGAETIPPILGRGVLLDIAGLKKQSLLPDGYAISPEELKSAAASAGVPVEKGDHVVIRTGKVQQYIHDNAAFKAGCPGLSGAAARWLADRGAATVGIDTTSGDANPCKDWSKSAHRELLVERGVHILENLNLEELAADRLYEFFFVCLPLKITGATGSWIRPAAVV